MYDCADVGATVPDARDRDFEPHDNHLLVSVAA
jgi:hypothetical protein